MSAKQRAFFQGLQFPGLPVFLVIVLVYVGFDLGEFARVLPVALVISSPLIIWLAWSHARLFHRRSIVWSPPELERSLPALHALLGELGFHPAFASGPTLVFSPPLRVRLSTGKLSVIRDGRQLNIVGAASVLDEIEKRLKPLEAIVDAPV